MNIPPHIQSIAAPVIDVLNSRAAALRADGASVISLGQAVPGFPPPQSFTDAALKAITQPDVNVYSADAGIVPLREALCQKLHSSFGIRADPQSEMIITSGANQAFMLVLQTLLEPRDEVLLPTPYYLNHEMAIRIIGAVPVEVPLDAGDGFDLTLERIAPYVLARTKALVIVNPNNPTGAVYRKEELIRIAEFAASKKITIISDETYFHFLYNGKKHFSLASLENHRSNIITIGSLSKSFAITGWRVGFLIGSAPFIEQAMKVQDSMVICATVISQYAAYVAVTNSWDYTNEFLPSLQEKRKILTTSIESMQGVSWTQTDGGFFAFMKIQGCDDSVALSMDILDSMHVVTTPGSIFGRSADGFIRISYGSASAKDLRIACDRLEKYFHSR